MIIYNVTIKIEPEVAENWLEWMKNEHIPDLMNTGLFAKYQICKLLEQDEIDGSTYSIQYYCNNMQQYNDYISNYATEMRARAFHHFGNKFVAFRSLLEIID